MCAVVCLSVCLCADVASDSLQGVTGAQERYNLSSHGGNPRGRVQLSINVSPRLVSTAISHAKQGNAAWHSAAQLACCGQSASHVQGHGIQIGEKLAKAEALGECVYVCCVLMLACGWEGVHRRSCQWLRRCVWGVNSTDPDCTSGG